MKGKSVQNTMLILLEQHIFQLRQSIKNPFSLSSGQFSKQAAECFQRNKFSLVGEKNLDTPQSPVENYPVAIDIRHCS